MAKPTPRERFETLRQQYLDADRKRDEHDSALRSKYGRGWRPWWLTAAEERAANRLRNAHDKASREFFGHLQSISPRDWSYGVPAYWLYEKLTFEDAVRPASEALSVVPPLAYGATVPRS